jgi:hypothetical protein
MEIDMTRTDVYASLAFGVFVFLMITMWEVQQTLPV